jgi:cytochrome P450
MKTNLPDILTERCRKSGSRRPTKLGPVLLVHDPDDMRHILSDVSAFDKSAEVWKAVESLLGEKSLITLPTSTEKERSAWSTARVEFMRRADALSDDVLAWAADRMRVAVESKVVKSKPLDLEPIALGYTGDVIGRLWDIDESTMAQVLPRVHIAMGGMVRQMLASLTPKPLDAVIRPSTFARVCGELRELLRERHDEVCTALAAGRDTVAAALCWHLLREQEPGELVKSPARTLALYPPIWFLPRQSVGFSTLPSGASIKPKTLLVLLPYAVQRLYPGSELLAFGYGPRRCAGARPALRMIASAAHALAGLEFFPHGDRSPVGRITLWSADTRAYVRKR